MYWVSLKNCKDVYTWVWCRNWAYFSFGSSEGLKNDRMDGLSLVVYMRYFDKSKCEISVLVV